MAEPTYGPPPDRQIGNLPNGAAITSVVTGVLALLLSWIPGINLIAFVLALVALITGAIGLRNAGRPGVGGKGKAITGIVTAVLAVAIGILVYVGLVSLFNDPEVQEQLEILETEIQEQQQG